jgi:hypothetical protein
MAKKSIYRDFIAALRKHWRAEFPFIRQCDEGCGSMPKASTFYAGITRPSGMHVFLYFQHNSKSWKVGQFTINVILSKDKRSPRHWGPSERADDGSGLWEGPRRIGHLVGSKDKWWHLKDDAPATATQQWRPTSYSDTEVVLREAVEDVGQDVMMVLRNLGVPEAAIDTPLTAA